ncbi:uncharacterized protein BXIN_1599 [Babesia sp. Xinjiang]|uniref:uncharacterized protein n=1 Tax=Babesia sp. Xinjiang TaxID=462227 RepID=UPI000A26629F|nr:uncharacterized protein BXIN_1599 [Babesia sp. Xinjiang]ORM40232.1 hypothetical protein BXIN_1599 [Babesia sp. Xinjiang]
MSGNGGCIQLLISLVDNPPGNLKECIDWVLRLTEKDEHGQINGHSHGKGNSDAMKGLAEKLLELLTAVYTDINQNEEKYGGERNTNLETDKAVLEAVLLSLHSELTTGKNGLIDKLSHKLRDFIGWNGSGGLTGSGIGNKNLGNQYKSAYGGMADWQKVTSEQKQSDAACLFLGALPVIFSGLSYLYWQCAKPSERWDKDTMVTITNTNNALGIFFQCCGYETNRLNSLMYASGMQPKSVKQLLGGGTSFTEFNGATSKVSDPYPVYINEVLTNATCNPEQYPLSSLYLCSTYYFQHQQTKQKYCKNQPSTIREMLYWLMALPYTQVIQQLSNKPSDIKNYLGKKDNSITFINGSRSTIPFNLQDIPSYLLPPCFNAGFILMTIQGKLCTPNTTIVDTTPGNPPNIHSIYSNSHFQFNYPDNPTDWFDMLWEVVYNLIYKLNFLREQCKTCVGIACGWLWCRYGGEIAYFTDKDGTNLKSWICKGPSCTPRSTGSCNQSQHSSCGTNGTPSPLQAFLCDTLNGFRNPTPMGFENHSSKFPQSRYGKLITTMLNPFLDKSRDDVSLYNLFICCCCVTLRNPLTIADIFPFLYYLGKCYQNPNGGGTDSMSLSKLIESQIESHLWSGIHNKPNKTDIGTRLKALSGNGTANKHNGVYHPADLHSLYGCNDTANCLGFIRPLSCFIYTTFVTNVGDRYLSCIVYLYFILYEALQGLMHNFKQLNCEKEKGCSGSCKPTGNLPCHSNMDQQNCECTSVVHCSGVLPLLYANGFAYHFQDTTNAQISTKCKAFSDHLSAVLKKGGPYDRLLKAINTFLYHIRKPFLLYLLTFWLLVLTYLTYSLTIPLDILHLRSHLRTAVLSPLVLLTNYTQPHDITYFQP